MRVRFEYKVMRITASQGFELENILNGLGKDQWELVSLIPYGVYPAITFAATFKKTISTDRP